jgi:ankyrin repeat protein/ribosomal protein L24
VAAASEWLWPKLAIHEANRIEEVAGTDIEAAGEVAVIKVLATNVKPFTLENVIDDLCSIQDVKAALNVSDEEAESFCRNVRLQLISTAWACGIDEAEALLKEESKLSTPVSDAGSGEEIPQNKLLTSEKYLVARRKLHGSKLLQLLGILSNSSAEISTAVEELRRKMAISKRDIEQKVEAEFWLWPKYMQLFTEFGELRDITTTPFMVEIVVGILRELHGQQPTPAQFKQELALQMRAEKRLGQEFKTEKSLAVGDAEDIDQLVEKAWLDWKEAKLTTIEGLWNAQSYLEPANKSEQVIMWVDEMSSRKRLIEEYENVLKRKPLVRYVIYDTFVQHFIQREAEKSLQLASSEFSVHEIMSDAAMYANKLAVKMTTENMVKVRFSDNDSIFKAKSDWDVFFNQDEITARIRSSVPIQPSGGALEFIHKSVQEFCVAKCILDEVLSIMDKADIKPNDTEESDALSAHPMAQVAKALGRGFDMRANSLKKKKEQPSDIRLMRLLMQEGIPEDKARRLTQQMEQGNLVVKDLAAGEAATEESRITQLQQNILANDAAMKKMTDTLKLKKQADRKRISNQLAIFISELEDAALNKLDLAPEEAIVDFLVDVLISDSNKATALMVAAQFCDRDRLQQLGENIKTLCTMKLPKRKGGTILHVAAECGNMTVAKGVIKFLKHIDDDGEAKDSEKAKSLGVDMKDVEGATPLHLAAAKSRTYMVALLLQNDADIGITQISGIGVMHLAAKAGAHMIVRLLIKRNSQLIVEALTLHETSDEDTKGKKERKLMLAKDPSQFATAFARFDDDHPIMKEDLKKIRKTLQEKGITGRLIDVHSDRTVTISFPVKVEEEDGAENNMNMKIPLEALEGDYRKAVKVTGGDHKRGTGRLTAGAYKKLGGRRMFKPEYKTEKAEERTGRLQVGDRVKLTRKGDSRGSLGLYSDGKTGVIVQDNKNSQPFGVKGSNRTHFYTESDVEFVLGSDRQVRSDEYEVIIEGTMGEAEKCMGRLQVGDRVKLIPNGDSNGCLGCHDDGKTGVVVENNDSEDEDSQHVCVKCEGSNDRHQYSESDVEVVPGLDRQGSTVKICGGHLKFRSPLPNVELLNATVKTDAAEAFARDLARKRPEDLVNQIIRIDFGRDTWQTAKVLSYDEMQANWDGESTPWMVQIHTKVKDENNEDATRPPTWMDLVGNTNPQNDDMYIHGFTLSGESADETRVGTTPVMIAAQENQSKVLKLLIDAGADTDALDNEAKADAMSALEYAHERNKKEAAKVLEEAGASGYTPLHVAAKYGRIDKAHWLLKSDDEVTRKLEDLQKKQAALDEKEEDLQRRIKKRNAQSVDTSDLEKEQAEIDAERKELQDTFAEYTQRAADYINLTRFAALNALQLTASHQEPLTQENFGDHRIALELAAEYGRHDTLKNLIDAVKAMAKTHECALLTVKEAVGAQALHLACKNVDSGIREDSKSKNVDDKKGDDDKGKKGDDDKNKKPDDVKSKKPDVVKSTKDAKKKAESPASHKDFLRTIDILLHEESTDCNGRVSLDGNERDEQGKKKKEHLSPLMIATTRSALTLLLKQKTIDVDATGVTDDDDERPALFHHCGLGNVEAVETLLYHGLGKRGKFLHAEQSSRTPDGLATVLWSDNAYGVREGDVVKWGDDVKRIQVGDLVDLPELTNDGKEEPRKKVGERIEIVSLVEECRRGEIDQVGPDGTYDVACDNGKIKAHLLKGMEAKNIRFQDGGGGRAEKFKKGDKVEVRIVKFELSSGVNFASGENEWRCGDSEKNAADPRIKGRAGLDGLQTPFWQILDNTRVQVTGNGNTKLKTALKIAKMLLDKGADPRVAKYTGLAFKVSYFYQTSVSNTHLMLTYLTLLPALPPSELIHKYPLFNAIRCYKRKADGNIVKELVKLLLDHGADLTALDGMKLGDDDGLVTALGLACSLDCEPVVDLLLEVGACKADLNATRKGGLTTRREGFPKETWSAAEVIRRKEALDGLICRGNSTLMTKLHTKGADGYTRLHTDCRHGLISADLSETLKEHVGPLNVKTHQEQTLLHLAVEANSVDCVRELLPYWTPTVLDIDERDFQNRTALMLAKTETIFGTVPHIAHDPLPPPPCTSHSYSSFRVSIDLILYKDAAYLNKDLYKRIDSIVLESSEQDVPSWTTEFQDGLESSEQKPWNGNIEGRKTASGDPEMACTENCDLDHYNPHFAPQSFKYKHESLFLDKPLLRYRSDINAADHLGRTVLMQASLFCTDIVAHVLSKDGVQINKKDTHGYTALHACCCEEYPANTEQDTLLRAGVVTALLKNDPPADLHARNNKGFTPLMLACKSFNIEVASVLLAEVLKEAEAEEEEESEEKSHWQDVINGVQPELTLVEHHLGDTNKKGETALKIARAMREFEIARAKEGETALEIARAMREIERANTAIQYLRKIGADGYTRLHYAAYYETTIKAKERKKLLEGKKKKQLTAKLPAKCPGYAGRAGPNALHLACQSGNIGFVKELLPLLEKRDTNTVNERDGFTALMYASTYLGGNDKLVQLLLEKGADLDKRVVRYYRGKISSVNKKEGTCDITYANRAPTYGESEKGMEAKKIQSRDGTGGRAENIKEGDKVEVRSDDCANKELCKQGLTALMLATVNDKATDATAEKVVETILKHQKDKGKDHYMKTLLEEQGRLRFKHPSNPSSRHLDNGTTLLLATCNTTKPKIGVMRMLLAYGADVEAKTTKHEATCLVIACIKNRINVVELLLQLPKLEGYSPEDLPNKMTAVNIDAIDQFGFSALMYSCQKGRLRIVKMLCLKNADLDVCSKTQRRTALMLAANESEKRSTQGEIVGELLKAREGKIDINREDKYGFTALALACRRVNVKIVEMLLEHGALETSLPTIREWCVSICKRGTKLVESMDSTVNVTQIVMEFASKLKTKVQRTKQEEAEKQPMQEDAEKHEMPIQGLLASARQEDTEEQARDEDAEKQPRQEDAEQARQDMTKQQPRQEDTEQARQEDAEERATEARRKVREEDDDKEKEDEEEEDDDEEEEDEEASERPRSGAQDHGAVQDSAIDDEAGGDDDIAESTSSSDSLEDARRELEERLRELDEREEQQRERRGQRRGQQRQQQQQRVSEPRQGQGPVLCNGDNQPFADQEDKQLRLGDRVVYASGGQYKNKNGKIVGNTPKTLKVQFDGEDKPHNFASTSLLKEFDDAADLTGGGSDAAAFRAREAEDEDYTRHSVQRTRRTQNPPALDEFGDPYFDASTNPLAEGDYVRVISGTHKDKEAEIDSFTPKRVRIQFGNGSTATLASKNMEKLSEEDDLEESSDEEYNRPHPRDHDSDDDSNFGDDSIFGDNDDQDSDDDDSDNDDSDDEDNEHDYFSDKYGDREDPDWEITEKSLTEFFGKMERAELGHIRRSLFDEYFDTVGEIATGVNVDELYNICIHYFGREFADPEQIHPEVTRKQSPESEKSSLLLASSAPQDQQQGAGDSKRSDDTSDDTGDDTKPIVLQRAVSYKGCVITKDQLTDFFQKHKEASGEGGWTIEERVAFVLGPYGGSVADIVAACKEKYNDAPEWLSRQKAEKLREQKQQEQSEVDEDSEDDEHVYEDEDDEGSDEDDRDADDEHCVFWQTKSYLTNDAKQQGIDPDRYAESNRYEEIQRQIAEGYQKVLLLLGDKSLQTIASAEEELAKKTTLDEEDTNKELRAQMRRRFRKEEKQEKAAKDQDAKKAKKDKAKKKKRFGGKGKSTKS